MYRNRWAHAVALASLTFACGSGEDAPAPTAPAEPPAAAAPVAPPEPAGPDRAALANRAGSVLGALPASAENPCNPGTEAKIDLGRMLYYDTRLSKNHDISCNSCHALDGFGVDNEATSPGHKGQRGERNSPTVLNAALHIAQFWDGRAADVEEQALGPVLNPVEMAGASGESVVAVLESIPGYVDAFAAAFPEDDPPLSYENVGRAIGAFERKLLTPSRFDDFVGGQLDALNDAELAGLVAFMDSGCVTCHMGPVIGGRMYQKLGAVAPYDTADTGRFQVTGEESDRFVFKVPSLRNVTRTGPYFHDGSIALLSDAVRVMAEHQLGMTLDDATVASIVAFLGSLEGRVDEAYVAPPELPENGPDTPAPDPS